MRKLLVVASALVGGILVCVAMAGDEPSEARASPRDKKADRQPTARVLIRQAAVDFSEAFNRADARVVASHWTEDGDYVNENGQRLQGLAAIEREYAAFFAAQPGVTVQLSVDSIRLLDSDQTAKPDTSVPQGDTINQQLQKQLNHPNTIAIYDYGRTPEGVFYYAMEYLNGVDLQALVDDYGPQSEQRVIHILMQVCGSLYEAHSQGLVHRDIKPANIMLNRRGCEPDVVKVLDFGLVKAIDDERQAKMTSGGSLTGTPLYMSPEAIKQVTNNEDGNSASRSR